jgi:hypothetical protein
MQDYKERKQSINKKRDLEEEHDHKEKTKDNKKENIEKNININLLQNAYKLALHAQKTNNYKSTGSLKLIRFNYKPSRVSFDELIDLQEYKDSLFIFNDNVGQFEDYYLNKENATIGLKNGAGNACIRSWQLTLRSIGVPTGDYNKYKKNVSFNKLSLQVISYVDLAMASIKEILDKNKNYNQIIYSGTDAVNDKLSNDNLGVDLFSASLGVDVRWYIVGRLRDLVDSINLK